jgi:hypothetical protein
MQPELWQKPGAELKSGQLLVKDTITSIDVVERVRSIFPHRDEFLLLLPRKSRSKNDKGRDKTTIATTSQNYRSSPAAMRVCRLAGYPSVALSDSGAQQYARIEGR